MSYKLIRGKPQLKSYKRSSVNKALNNDYDSWNGYYARGSHNHYTGYQTVHNGTLAYEVYDSKGNRKLGYR